MGNVNMEAKQIHDRTEAGKHQSVADHLKALDAIAASIENLPTFTSNDRAFLEELPAFPTEDGTKVLTATTSSGETSLSYEEVESGAPDYSTTEQATGQKWIDGKDIYFKTVDCGSLPDNTSKLVDAGLSNVTVVKIEGIAIGGSFIPLPHITTNNVYIEISYESSNEVFIRTNGYFSTMHGYVTLYYTKNTV